MDVAEKRFAWLLKQRGFLYWPESKLENKIEVKGKRPDFFVDTKIIDIMVEVESLREPGPLDVRKNKIGNCSPEEFFERLRGPVKHAAKQLKPYKDLRIPCLVVLDNWRRLKIPTGIIELVQIFGTIKVQGEIDDERGMISQTQFCRGKEGRRLKEDQHTYVSAVAVIIPKVRFDAIDCADDMTDERPMKLLIAHNPFTVCPLPFEVFSDEDDEQYYYADSKWTKYGLRETNQITKA
jgi:hypothetical protein